MWTAPAFASEACALAGNAWRVVESQSQVATMKLVEGLDERAFLEAELNGSKPVVLASCAGLNYLLRQRMIPRPGMLGARRF